MADSDDRHEQFTRLFLAHEPEILRAVLPFVPHRPDAREVVQETAVALWRHFAEYDPGRPFGAWACGFARIEVRRFLRAAARQRSLSEKAAAALMAARSRGSADPGEFVGRLAGCLDRLPPDARRLIEGYYTDDRPVERLAAETGRSVDAVYKAIQRSRRALADCVDSRRT